MISIIISLLALAVSVAVACKVFRKPKSALVKSLEERRDAYPKGSPRHTAFSKRLAALGHD